MTGMLILAFSIFPISESACTHVTMSCTLVRKPAVCLMFMSRRQVRAKFDTFSVLQRQKLVSIMPSYRICLHKTAQLVTL